MGKYFKIYGTFVKQFFKTLMEYRLDFAIGSASFLIDQLANIAFLFLVLTHIPLLDGFTYNELLLIYGIYLIPRGIDHLLTDNIWVLPRKIIAGEVDMYLLRPLNPLFQLVAEKVDLNGITELVTGVGFILFTMPHVNISIVNGFDILALILFTISGTIIYTSIKLFFSSFSFFIMNSFPLLQSAYSMSEYSKYPMTIYPKFIRVVLQFVLPFAYTSYFPAIYILGIDKNPMIVLYSCVTAIVMFSIAYGFWNFGLKHYESAGS